MRKVKLLEKENNDLKRQCVILKGKCSKYNELIEKIKHRKDDVIVFKDDKDNLNVLIEELLVSENKMTKKDFYKNRIKEIDYKEKYALCLEIEKAQKTFVEFYLSGKATIKLTKNKAIEYAKKNFNQKDYKIVSEWGIKDLCIEVKKLRKPKEVKNV